MGDSIDNVVKSWLTDPQWQKVFKHTFDVFQVKVYNNILSFLS
jgi:hypothetical protein